MPAINVSAMDLEDLLGREWLLTNALGGFACSTVAGLNTRKYHGLLVAAMSPPLRRMVLLSRVEEVVRVGRKEFALACSEYPGTIHPTGHEFLRAFSTEPFPRWAYQGDGWTLEKSVRLLDAENTVCISYTLLGGTKPVGLELRPLLALRGIHDLAYQWNAPLEIRHDARGFYRVLSTSRTPEVFFAADGNFDAVPDWYESTIYRREAERGYAGLEDLWTPGYVNWTMEPGQTVHFACSSEPLELGRVVGELERQPTTVIEPVVSTEAQDATLQTLTRAVLEFPVCSPAGVTQYPWAAPSVRDALIALPGMLLVTHRHAAAKRFLLDLVPLIRDGLLPAELPEDGGDPIYAAADVALWYVNAVEAYVRHADDPTAGKMFLEPVLRIIRAYQGGTKLGISTDADGLLLSHEPGIGTTWMDAKVGQWVITPRQGRAVEVNALWYNAICVVSQLSQGWDRAERSSEFARLAESVRAAFNRRFWNEMAGCCFDAVSERGTDPSIRPNQLFAISLRHAVLEPHRWAPVLDRVRGELLTPVGIRTLAASDPAYVGRYVGDVVARDRALHQGSVFPWLLGPYVTAHVKTFVKSPQARQQAARCIEGCVNRIRSDGLGHLCELFDGDPPHEPRGALASLVGTAELLRCYVEDILGVNPQNRPRADRASRPGRETQQPRPLTGKGSKS